MLGLYPERRVALYFAAAILIGALLLRLPISSAGDQISFVDALFTSASAVCVTGLTVMDTGTAFSLFGQFVILFLFQLGGLGIMTLASALLLSIGTRIPLRDKVGLSQTFAVGIKTDIRALLKAVVLTTFVLEVVGAIALLILFGRQLPFGKACFAAIFHSVSAFCNAGFSTFSNSLEDYQSDIPVILVFSVLIICGGLGFIVIQDLYSRIRDKRHGLSLHSKLCLSVSTILLAGGTIGFLVAEHQNIFVSTDFGHNLANAFFQSVTSRTAGFNTIAQSSFSEMSIVLTLILMFIGACPGSTGGGIKTTTFALLLLLVRDRIAGRQTVSAFKRTFSNDSVARSLTVILLAILVIGAVFTLFTFSEGAAVSHRMSRGWFAENLFEVVSAFANVGLSMGVTPHLKAFGKVVLILTMFIGRVGLLTLAFALARPKGPGEIIYREEEIMVG